jgi:hypothetical protein
MDGHSNIAAGPRQGPKSALYARGCADKYAHYIPHVIARAARDTRVWSPMFNLNEGGDPLANSSAVLNLTRASDRRIGL